MKIHISILAACCLSGCLAAPQPMPAPQVSLLDADTLALSCTDLSTRNANLKTRISELEAENRKAQRRQAITGAAINVGLSTLIGVGAGVGVGGLRAAGATVGAVNSVRSAEAASEQLAQVQDGLALAQRSAQLQRAMIEKGC